MHGPSALSCTGRLRHCFKVQSASNGLPDSHSWVGSEKAQNVDSMLNVQL